MSISPLIWFILIWAINSAGLFALAGAMSKHQKPIFGCELKTKHSRYLSYIGWLLLMLALGLCTAQGHWSTHISYWIGSITFSALFTGLCISYYPQQVKKIASVTLILAILCLLFTLF